MEEVQILIKSGGEIQEPIIYEGVTWETSRKGEPSKLSFTCIKDDKLSFSEGAEVSFRYGDTDVFHGFVFQKQRNKEHHIKVTAYDQLRYLTNKTTYRWTGIRADQVLTRIAKDFKLNLGDVENTKFVINNFDKRDMSLFDIILDAIDETVMNTGELYYLYDDFGKLTLKNIKDSKTDFLIDDETAEDFNYTTSIDTNTYNRIVIAEDSGMSGSSNYTAVNDFKNQDKWGVLQYFESGYKGINAKAKAKALLELHNIVQRSLVIEKQLGDIRIRAGCGVYLDLNLGDMIAKQLMLVEKAVHKFENGHHYMDITLNGNREFYS